MTEQEQRDIFAQNLTYWMDVRGYRGTDLAEELEVSNATTSCWMLGKKVPRMGKIQHIADWLGVQISDLICEKGDAADDLRDRVFAKSPALFKALDKATPAELHEIEVIANAIIDESH